MLGFLLLIVPQGDSFAKQKALAEKLHVKKCELLI